MVALVCFCFKPNVNIFSRYTLRFSFYNLEKELRKECELCFSAPCGFLHPRLSAHGRRKAPSAGLTVPTKITAVVSFSQGLLGCWAKSKFLEWALVEEI